MSTSHIEPSTSSRPLVAADAEGGPGQAEVSHTAAALAAAEAAVEIGGRGGLEPTRFGDWEKGGRCIDF